MLGGNQEPCFPYLPLPEWRDETTGELIRRERPCPRVELLEENRAILPVVRAVINETTRPLAPLVAEVTLQSPINREARVLRVLNAVQSKRVNDAIRAGAKQRAEAARKK